MRKNDIDKALQKKKEKKESKLKKGFDKFIDILNKKWLVHGTTTILLVLIIFAIYLGVTTLLNKVTLPEIDCTKDKVYSLSDETKTKVKNLNKDVKITLINYSSNSSIKDIINRYKSLSKKVTVEEINNLASRADIMAKYSLSTNSSLIVVSSGEKEKTISSSDLYTYDYTTNQQVDTTEEAITNAIVEVITDKKPKVYMLSNHVRYATTSYSTLTDILTKDANEVEPLDLLSAGKVPDDCNALIITTLKDDFTDIERDNILTYINNGGKLLLLCGTNIEGTALTNFQKILDAYGVSIEKGVIFEGTSSNMINGYPDFIVEEMTSNSTIKSSNMTLKACLIDAAAINTTTDSNKQTELGVRYETLMQTTSNAFIRTNYNIQSVKKSSSDSEAKSYTLGVLATKTVADNKTSKLIIYGNELFIADMPIQIESSPAQNQTYQTYAIALYNNKDIAANAVAYLNEREDLITIRKNHDDVSYNVTKEQHNVIMMIIFITPLVIIIVGIIVWQVRRRKNK